MNLISTTITNKITCNNYTKSAVSMNTHTHVYISTVLFSERRREKKNLEAVLDIIPN
jgi:hypothetical protein